MKTNFRTYSLLVLLLLLSSKFVFGEDQKIDSLKKQIPIHGESSKDKLLEIYRNLSGLYYVEEQHDSSIKYANELVTLALELGDENALSEGYSRLGIVYQYKGQFKAANEYNFKGLRIKERINASDKSMATSHSNIALSYQELGLYEKAIEHQKASLEFWLKAKDSSNAAMRYYMIGGALYQMKKYDTAKVYYDQAYEVYQRLGKKDFTSIYHTYVGLIHLKKNRLKKAEESFLESLYSYPEDGQKRTKVFIYSNLAVAYLVMGAERDSIGKTTLKKCIVNAEKTYELASEISFLRQMRKASEILYKAYDGLGVPEKAMVYAKQYIRFNDSLYNEDQQKTITEIQTQYETEKKEAEIEFLNKENIIKSENLEQAEKLQQNQLLIISILVIAIGLTIFFLIWIYRIYIQKKKANMTLEDQNQIILRQKDEREMLLKEIHHRVKNNLQVISSLLDIQSQEISDELALSAVEDGQSRVKAMALIHEKLYQNKEIGEIPFEDYVNQLVKQLASVYSLSEKVSCEINAGDIVLDIDTAIPIGLILNELVSNAYKYAFEGMDNGSLSIELKEIEKGEYCLTVKDNGAGLPKEFDLKKAKSLGLRLVNRLSRQLYGSVDYRFEKGAIFNIQFKDTIRRKLVQ